MDTDISFGRWLRQRRRVLNLTQEALARRAGCSVGTIRKIETAQQRPSEMIANRLADCLGIAGSDHATFILFARDTSSSKRPPMSPPDQGRRGGMLTTKLYVPRPRVALVPRPRLIDRLN